MWKDIFLLFESGSDSPQSGVPTYQYYLIDYILCIFRCHIIDFATNIFECKSIYII